MAIEDPRVDTSNVTVAAFNSIKQEEKGTKTNIRLLGRDDNKYNSPNFRVKVRAYTKTDNQYHSYFHSLSIDVNVDDFMGTAELKCPYDSDLMAYWEPIRQDVVIYGANRGKEKILFVGRVRGVKQDGYELVIEFQNYAWKFKQLVSQSYANDYVLNKNGYAIMCLMFEALKIDSYVISEGAKQRLRQVGINKDGNLTVNGEEIKKIPDLITRLKNSDPSKLVNKSTVGQKLKENELANIENINYTLKYEQPTPIMKKIAKDSGNYSAGSNVYDKAYGSPAKGQATTSGSAKNTQESNKNKNALKRGDHTVPNFYKTNTPCPNIQSTSVAACLGSIYAYNRGWINSTGSMEPIIKQAKAKHPNWTATKNCLSTMASYCIRSDKKNLAQSVLDKANQAYTGDQGIYYYVNLITKFFTG